MNGTKRILRLVPGWFGDVQGEQGQTLAEYSLALTLVAVGVVVLAVFLFSSVIAGTYDAVTACLSGGCL